mmetsp:Transcript_1311/g.3935  ORF Transcript_1311/g.3935 Transcript_1311/m.3935 type:complete len:243 (+) Transcript_1311:2-730(+)
MAQRGARSAPEPPTPGNTAATAEPQPTARTPAAGSPGTSGACVDCSSGRAQPKFREAFGISVCYDCQRAGRGEGGKYQVLSKSRAKDEYLLSDRQLDGERGGLRSMRLPNPNDARYGDMRLYLRRQVEELALATWGSSEALLLEKERRSDERLRRAEAKRKLKSGTPEEQMMARCNGRAAPKQQRRKAQAAKAGEAAARPPVRQLAAERHEHVFSPDEEYDEATDLWTKRCACGFMVQYERI